VGGGASSFATVAASPQLRSALATNLWNFAQLYGYDGVDIDWEYPDKAQAHDYFELLNTLRASFPAPIYLISTDVAPWGGPGYALNRVAPVVDFLNIMTYDCAGPWTTDAQLNSPIFWDSHDPDPWFCQPGGSVQEAINIYLHSAPASKLNIGTPFYGYFYETASALWGDCTFCNGTVQTEYYGTGIKFRVNNKNWIRTYDPHAAVPYLLRKNGKPGFITYDDPASTYLRVWYADWDRGLGGTFMWALDEDYDGSSQDLLDAMYSASLDSGGITQ
jgi:chitinase